MHLKSARQLAVEALCRVERENAWSNLALAAVLDLEDPTPQERAFASAIFYETLVRRYTIDQVIANYSKTPLDRMDADVRNILRSAVCQLLYMNSVPEHAAVSEAVTLCRTMKKTSAAGFVNGVLRAFLRDGKKLPTLHGATKEQQLALEYSCPPELVQQWTAACGQDQTLRMLRNSVLSPFTFLRVNPLKTKAETLAKNLREQGIPAELVPKMSDALLVKNAGALHHLREYDQGLFHVQDISSQLAGLSVGAQPGERILDLCAAPGGKAFVMAEQMGNTGTVVACDVFQTRMEEMMARAARLGLSNIEPHVLDMSVYHPEFGEFDRVLCDAPCSGYGTIRRRPEIKYRSLADNSALPDLQYKLLEAAGKYCKKGGMLVYSTCTLSPAENGAVVAKFLEQHPGFAPANTENPIFSDFEKTIFLGDYGGDGFYIAAMKRGF